MALEFCEHQDVVFENAPLVQVLSQIRFPPILSLMTVAGVTGFQMALRDSYPTMLEPTRQANIEIGADRIGAQASAPVWRFADETGNWTVGVAIDFVSLETPKYSHIQEFLERYEHILSVLQRTLRPAASLRTGFRKVNVFEAEGHDTAAFSRMLRSELLGPVAADAFPAPIGGCFANLSFVDDDNGFVIRHGLADMQEGEPMRYVLDMDYFTHRPSEIGGDSSLIEQLRYFSDGMTSFFHWAVTDEYKVELKPVARCEGSTS